MATDRNGRLQGLAVAGSRKRSASRKTMVRLAASVNELLNVWDYERAAEERLEPGAFGYFAGGADDEWTMRENVAACRRWVLRPRMLVDVSSTKTATSVLGTDVSMPLLVAPTAFQRMAHPEGEVATARGAAAAGTIMCLSTIANATIEEVAAAAPDAPRWFQLYWGRTAASSATSSRAPRQPVSARSCSRSTCPCSAVASGISEPGSRSRPVPVPVFSALAETTGASLPPPSTGWSTTRSRGTTSSGSDRSRRPLAVKGVLTAEDATLAVEAGARAVVVSNHARAASWTASPPRSTRCRKWSTPSVGEQVLVDGGIRRGTDVVKALALGARAALAGRAPLYGLAVDGADGVERVLGLLRAEIELALALCGCAWPADVTRTRARAR